MSALRSTVTIACGCGRAMTLDALRGRDAYRCGCGARVKITIPDEKHCAGYRDGQRCRSVAAAGLPVDLCVEHAKELREFWEGENRLQKLREYEDKYGPEYMARWRERSNSPKDPDWRKIQWLGLERILEGPDTHAPLIYYLRFADRIKIGTTTNLKIRLTAIPHDELLATEPGDVMLERRRHRQFDHLRLKGEWFRADRELLDHIESIRRGADGQRDDEQRPSTDDR